MKKEESIQQKAMRLKKEYGQEKAIEIINNDKNRFIKSKTYYKSEECNQAIDAMKKGYL